MSEATDLQELLNYEPRATGPKIWFKPRPGQGGMEEVYKIRLMPSYTNDTVVPFHSEVMHYLGAYGDRKALKGVCPGEGCPACARFWDLREFVKDREELSKALRVLGPNRRLYCNVLYDDEVLVWSLPHGGQNSGGVKFLGMWQQYLKEGLSLHDSQRGHTINVPVADAGSGMRYGNFTIAAKPSVVEFDPDDLHDLAAAGNNKILSIQQIDEYLPKALGEFYARLEDAYQAALKSGTPSKGTESRTPDLKSLTVPELHEMALEMGIHVPKKITKAKLVVEIKRSMG